jgi:cytoskeletal protein RodZ
MPPPIELPDALLQEKPRSWSLWLLGALVLVAAGLALSALFMKNEPQHVTTTPLKPPATTTQEPAEPSQPTDATGTETANANGTGTNEATGKPGTVAPAVAKTVEPVKPPEPAQHIEPTHTRPRRDPTDRRPVMTVNPERVPANEKPPKPKEPDILLNPYRSQ